MIFHVKKDLQSKSQLMADGTIIDIMDIPVYSSTVKNIRVQHLHVISHKADMKKLC